jgi:class 3 adenylate cyclase/tetratricopeptide (TPR) repeat protein
VICASCGQENPEGFRFCGRCGAELLDAARAEVRKTVTVVFCDLVGSTALGERTDPELLREVMGRYHGTLRAVLERHAGTVEKFVGDAAMAVFGLPHVHEDDALRAVRAAVEMRAAVAELGLEVRVGVNTGEVVAGKGETLVTGDAVNVAARLEQAASTGEILLGAGTQRLVRDAVRLEAVAPLSLKGKAEPVPAYRVVGLVDDVPAFTQPIRAPFVGRGVELERLDASLAAAVEGRAPQLVTVVGPPGIGKSRLVREFLTRARVRVLVGRCLSYGDGITYWPLSEVASQIGDLRAVLEGVPDGALAATRVGAALGTAAPASSEEIAWGFRRLFEAIAAEAPLVLVLDDIHWAEPALLDLLEYVATFAQDAALFVLCTARPDLFESRPAWAAPRSNATLVILEPLRGEESDALVAAFGDLSDDLRDRIVAAAEGNPLFVEQLVAMNAETGSTEVEVPPTLQALLAARIDRLDERERAVVERGSVEGRLFHRGAVLELLPDSERVEVGAQLLTLVRKELIRPDRATVPGDDAFRFGHILIRDAAYDAIPKRLRAVLHERYADWLAARLGNVAPDELVGYHLEQAYRYALELGAAAPAVGARAAERLDAAARAAGARSDVAAAVKLLARAVELVPDGPQRCGLLVHLARALAATAELDRAQQLLEEALALARIAGDRHLEWMSRLELAELRLLREPEGAAEAALREATDAIAEREPAGDHEVLAHAWALHAHLHLLAARSLEQKHAVETALGHARACGDLALEVELALSMAATIVYGGMSVDDGLRYADEMREQLGHVPSVNGLVLHVLGHLRARQGEFDGAREAITEWRERFRELGQERMFAITGGCVWDVCSLAGDWETGDAALRESYDILERMGERGYLSTIAAYRGEAALLQGQVEDALRFSEVSEALGTSDDVLNEALWRSVRARALVARGDLNTAEALAREALRLAESSDYFELVAAAWLDLGRILDARGAAGAADAAGNAVALYEQKGNLVRVEEAQALLSAWTATGK